MPLSLHIARLRSLYRVPSTLGAPEPIRARLDALASTAVGAALNRLVPSTLASLGLAPDAEIAIRRLSVRVRVRGAGVPDAALGDAWAGAIAEALQETLAPLARQGGGVTREAAIFPDRFAAERAYLLERFLGGASEWWWQPLLGAGTRVPSPREVLAGWIHTRPELVPGALASLALEVPDGLPRALSEDDARYLAAEVIVGREQRLDALRGARARTVERTAPGDVATPRAAHARGDVGQEAAAMDDGRPLHDLLGSPALRDLLAPSEIEALARVRAPASRRLLALCFLLARRPAALTQIARALTGPDAERSSREAPSESAGSSADTSGTDPDETRSGLRHSARDAGEGAAEGAPTPERARAPVASPEPTAWSTRGARGGHDREGEHAARELRVGCGGLLFLVRRVAASSLLDEHRGQELEDRLVALGWLALHRALDGLPEGPRRAAFARERPLLEVFSGVRALPEALHVEPRGPAARDAAARLDTLAASLPTDLAPCLDGVLTTYGPGAEPFGGDHPHRALAHLLLRPARLRVTPTRADLHLPARAVDVALRVGGWDIDPGFVPHLGRVIRFHYEER